MSPRSPYRHARSALRSSTLQQARTVAEDPIDHRPILVDRCAFTANRVQSSFSEDRLCRYTVRAFATARVRTEGGSPVALGFAAVLPRSLTSGTGFATRNIAASLAIGRHQNLRTKKLELVHFGCTGKISACYGATFHQFTGYLDLGTGFGFQR